MKKKLPILFLILIILGVIIYFIFSHISITRNDDYTNYTPEEEISESQSRETTINLYFLNPENNQLKSEGRNISTNELLKNPYKVIVQKLIDGPSDDKLKNVFPERTRLIDATLSNDCVLLNFSEELLNFKDDVQKYNIINSILDSLTQLNEVNSIKILINNEPNDKISQEYTSISDTP